MSGVYFNPFDGKLFTVPQKIGKADSPTFANLTLTGDLIVSGNNITTADLFVEDKTITLAFGSASAALSDGAGIIIDGANIQFLYDHSETAMTLNSDLLPEANATFDIGSSGLRWKDGWYSATVTANTFAGDLISSSVTITGGTISNTTIGATNPTTGAFTTATANTVVYGSNGTLRGANTTTTSTAQFTLSSFAAASYRSAKYVIQAVSAGESHVTELLVTHDGVAAVSTEYGILYTDVELFAVTADIDSGNVRVRVTPASATSTVFRIVENLLL
jgi:hypothetical protein